MISLDILANALTKIPKTGHGVTDGLARAATKSAIKA